MMRVISCELLPVVLNMSLTAGIIIAFVLLARLPLKKAPKVFSYALWSVVLFRLLCPVSVSAGFSLLGVLDAPVKETTSVTSSVEYVQPEFVSGAYPQAGPPLSGTGEAAGETLLGSEEQQAADPGEIPAFVTACVWTAGVLAMLTYGAVSLIRLRRKLIGAVLLRDNIYLADYISCPFVVGVLRPKIYLPSSLPEKERAYIILHEQHHIRRLDHIVKLLAFAALCVHWFNPLVWAAFLLCGKDMEMSCDEAVVKKMGEEIRADYSASLLSLATGRRIIAGTPLAFGEGDTGGRIRNLMNWKKSKVWISLAAAAVCVAVVTVCAANPVSAVSERTDPDTQDIALDAPLPEQEGEKDPAAAEHTDDEPGLEAYLPAADPPREQSGDAPEGEVPVSPPAEDDAHTAAEEDREAGNSAAEPYASEQPDPPAEETPAFSAADVEFSGRALVTSADAMTYEERLAWVQAGPVYDTDAYAYRIPLGEYREGEGCLAYVGEWAGTPHTGQYSLTIRFADGTEAGLSLPRSTFFGTALPDSMEFQNGRFVYEVYFADEMTADEGLSLIHLQGTYHYEVDLEAKTVSLTVL